jgi:hypothetical protein
MEAIARTVVLLQRFSERNLLHFLCGDGGNVTRQNVPAGADERQNNRTATSLRLPFQASAHVMDLDFKIFDRERLISEVEKRPTLYN